MYIYIWIVLVCRMDFHRIWLICTYYVHSNSTTLRRPPWIRRSKLSSCGMDSTSSAQPRIPMEWIMFNGKILENRGKSWDILGNHGKIVENHWNIIITVTHGKTSNSMGHFDPFWSILIHFPQLSSITGGYSKFCANCKHRNLPIPQSLNPPNRAAAEVNHFRLRNQWGRELQIEAM